ncbi:MAG: hypothetical protein QXL21_06575, partial [Nitrososphaerales archaeon]
ELLTLRDLVEIRLREMNEELKMLHARVKRLEDAAAKIIVKVISQQTGLSEDEVRSLICLSLGIPEKKDVQDK